MVTLMFCFAYLISDIAYAWLNPAHPPRRRPAMSIEVENAFAELATSPAYRQRSPLYFAWRRFLANKAAVVGGVVLAILILAAIFAPLFTKTDPTRRHSLRRRWPFRRPSSGSASTTSAAISSPASSTARASR